MSGLHTLQQPPQACVQGCAAVLQGLLRPKPGCSRCSWALRLWLRPPAARKQLCICLRVAGSIRSLGASSCTFPHNCLGRCPPPRSLRSRLLLLLVKSYIGSPLGRLCVQYSIWEASSLGVEPRAMLRLWPEVKLRGPARSFCFSACVLVLPTSLRAAAGPAQQDSRLNKLSSSQLKPLHTVGDRVIQVKLSLLASMAKTAQAKPMQFADTPGRTGSCCSIKTTCSLHCNTCQSQ